MNKAKKRNAKKNAGYLWESNPGPLTLATSAFTNELQQPTDNHNFTIFYDYASGTEYISRKPGTHVFCLLTSEVVLF